MPTPKSSAAKTPPPSAALAAQFNDAYQPQTASAASASCVQKTLRETLKALPALQEARRKAEANQPVTEEIGFVPSTDPPAPPEPPEPAVSGRISPRRPPDWSAFMREAALPSAERGPVEC